MYTRAIKVLANSIKFTPEQQAIIVGLTLGDGHLATANKGRTYYLKIEHALGQKEYVDWLYQQFRTMVLRCAEVTGGVKTKI